MRIAVQPAAQDRIGLVESLVALHDGLYDGQVISVTPTEMSFSYPEIEIELTLFGSGFSFGVGTGTITGIEISDSVSGTLAVVFDQMNLSVDDLGTASAMVDSAQFGDDDPSDEAALWYLLTGTGLTYTSRGVLNEGQQDVYGPTFNSLNGTKLPWHMPGDDNLTLSGRTETMHLGSGADILRAGGGADTIRGQGGNDRLFGNGGDDWLYGDGGRDKLFGGRGGDVLHGGGQKDELNGQGGADALSGEAGNDVLSGDGGNDTLYGGKGRDKLSGDAGRDTLYGDEGNDRLFGNKGNDILYGGAGRDKLFGGAGNDTLYGDFQPLKDDIYPGPFADVLNGGAGDDRFEVYSGNDTIITGSGRDDVFIWYVPANNENRPMHVTITDFRGKDDIEIATRYLDDFREARSEAQREDDNGWWRDFFQTVTAGNGDVSAVFSADGLTVEIEGHEATRSLFDDLF